jgi:drug/metabolite transporter (DMT)-like permease
MCFIPVGDTAGKLLGAAGVEPVFIAWSRFGLGAILVWAAYGGRGFDPSVFRDRRYWLRAVLITVAVTCILTALKTEPIANVFAAFFVGPILSYFLAAWLLRERITGARTALLFAGFCGVLLVVRPGMETSGGLGWALFAGLLYGCFLVATKWLSGTVNPRSLLVSHLTIGAVLLTPWGVAAIPEASGATAMLVLASAAASAVGNLMHTIATRMADASRLAPATGRTGGASQGCCCYWGQDLERSSCNGGEHPGTGTSYRPICSSPVGTVSTARAVFPYDGQLLSADPFQPNRNIGGGTQLCQSGFDRNLKNRVH